MLRDFFEMQWLAPSYKPDLVRLYKIWRGHAKAFEEEKGMVTLTTKPGAALQIGDGGAGAEGW